MTEIVKKKPLQGPVSIKSCAIAIFVKTPGLTPLKTRLAKSIGTDKAHSFYRASLKCIEEQLSLLDSNIFFPHWAVTEKEGLCNPIWEGFPTLLQTRGGLGARLHHIYSFLIQSYDFVLMIGADSPQLRTQHYIQAHKELLNFDFVMGPANDGGFYLFGGKKHISESLWLSTAYSQPSTAKALAHSLQGIGELTFLSQLFDVDTLKELQQLASIDPQFQVFLPSQDSQEPKEPPKQKEPKGAKMLEINPSQKFSHSDVTAKGEARAWVAPTQLQTLWFNTGTLCNLTCHHCYIESSPKNDRLSYITTEEVQVFLDEIHQEKMGTQEIGFTGGEPFMNPHIIDTLKLSLSRGFQVLVLTNGMKPMMKKSEELLGLCQTYGSSLKIRVSIDHYKKEKHTLERGMRSWEPTIQGLQWLSKSGFQPTVGGRTLWGESIESMRKGYQKMFHENNIDIDAFNPQRLVLFPEMDETVEVPEITTKCWDILKVQPQDMMCATSRMVVKRKGQHPSVVACTLLPYDQAFEMGTSLRESWKKIKLNHHHCAKFCVLGGGSCSNSG